MKNAHKNLKKIMYLTGCGVCIECMNQRKRNWQVTRIYPAQGTLTRNSVNLRFFFDDTQKKFCRRNKL